MNVAVLVGLLFFTGLTVAAYRIRLGEWNLTVALLIATLKMILVGTFFMHLKWERPFNTLFFVGAFVGVGIFLLYTTNDTHHRAQVDPNWGNRFDTRTGNYAYGTAPLITQYGSEDEPLPGEEAQGAAGEGSTAPAEGAAPAQGAAAAEGAAPAEEAAPAEGAAAPAEGAAPAEEAAPTTEEAAPAGGGAGAPAEGAAPAAE